MKAFILAAGLGQRLKPLTDTQPKALVKIGDKPMLEHVILKLKRAGFDKLVINIHYRGDQILDFLRINDNFGLDIAISDEREYLLDTGGALKKAAPLLGYTEPFMVHNVDIMSDVDLASFYQHHVASDAIATLLVSQRETSRYLLFDNEQRMVGWHNKTSNDYKSPYPQFDPNLHNHLAFGGIHMISPDIFKILEDWTGKFSIIDFYLSICAKFIIRSYTPNHLQLMDVGKSETLEQAEKQMKQSM